MYNEYILKKFGTVEELLRTQKVCPINVPDLLMRCLQMYMYALM